MRARLVAILFIACSLSSCATISAGYYADVYLEGYDGPLTVTDTSGRPIEIVQGRIAGKQYSYIKLDKREDPHTVVVSNGAESSTHYLFREINYNWLIPNLFNYEVGFLVDWYTEAVYDFPDIELSYRTRGVNLAQHIDSLEHLLTARYSVYVGWAMPVYQVPVMFTHMGLSVGVKWSDRLAAAAELNMNALSAQKADGRDLQLFANEISLPFSFYVFPDLFISVAPTYQWLSFYEPGFLDEPDVLLASRNNYTIGFGGGVRLGHFLLEFRSIPSIWPQEVPKVGEWRQTVSQLRFGFTFDEIIGS